MAMTIRSRTLRGLRLSWPSVMPRHQMMMAINKLESPLINPRLKPFTANPSAANMPSHSTIKLALVMIIWRWGVVIWVAKNCQPSAILSKRIRTTAYSIHNQFAGVMRLKNDMSKAASATAMPVMMIGRNCTIGLSYHLICDKKLWICFC